MALVVAGAVVMAALAPRVASANHDVPVLPDVFPKIRAILSPLASQPSIVEDGASLRVELDPELVDASALDAAGASLQPSFGSARPAVELPLSGAEPDVPSELWPGRTVHALTFSIPQFGESFVEDLYDLSVAYGTETDTQHRAVKVVDSYPKAPTFAIIADPSVGDPRPLQDGAEELAETGSPDSLVDKTQKTVGNPMTEDRWAALGKAIDEINLLQPDFVLITGDLTFLLYPRPANIEYEDAYRILSRLRVPAFVSPGNHDLYDLDYDDVDRPHTSDGKQLWPQYFGPLYYSVDVGGDLHLVSLNTFDWPDDRREALDEGDEFSTRAGGDIGEEQFEWLTQDLDTYRTGNPRGTIVTFAHHDPSWIQARHPWAGEKRLETRDLIAEMDVGVHFAGHTHEDRVARFHQGQIVETNGRRGPVQQLHRVLRNNDLDESLGQAELGSVIRDPRIGPLFVTTTTVSSALRGSDWGLGGYWGYRFGVLDDRVETSEGLGPPCGTPAGPGPNAPVACGFDPIDFGYPATREFLDERAERPQNWNPDHAEYGVFSYPSYYLNASTESANDGTEESSSVTITNDLLVDVRIEIVLSVAGDGATVEGGGIVWERSHDGVTDVRVRTTIPSGGDVTLSATSNQ
jgi:hypothetical protein